MTAIVLPDIDKATIDELRKKLPDLREIELPTMKEVKETAKDVGKTADETIDRLLGRSKAPVWPWVAAGIGLVAVLGAVAAYIAWWRRPAWETPAERPREGRGVVRDPDDDGVVKAVRGWSEAGGSEASRADRRAAEVGG